MEPAKNAFKFTHQCGVVVRDNVPISIQEWVKQKDETISYVSDRMKDVLWSKVISHFTLPVFDSPEATQACLDAVKHYSLKKMAEQFNNYKKRLYAQYQDKMEEDPEFIPEFTGTLEMQRSHWDLFLQYKQTEKAKERSRKNKENASKKVYHHKLGAGGYRSAEPKWNKQEAEMREKGIIPVTDAWDHRLRNWVLGHGAEYDMNTGDLIVDKTKPVCNAHKAIYVILDKVQAGTFIPDREKDVLSEALGNFEKEGRTRGFGPDVAWIHGFAQDRISYRSRARAKKRKELEDADRFSKLEKKNDELFAIVRQLQENQMRQPGPTDHSPGGLSQRRSSVASTPLGADESHPVDYITEKTACELHVGVRNLSMKAAAGYALPSESTTLLPIPDGYARVGVDQICPPYASMELEIPPADDVTTLGDVDGGIILWPKKYIVIPGWAPPSSTPSRNSPPPSPHDEDRDDEHQSTSPSPRQPTPEPSPRQPTPESSPRQPTPEPSPPPRRQSTPPPRRQSTPQLTSPPRQSNPQSAPPPPPTQQGRKVQKRKSVSAMGSRQGRPRLEPLPKVPRVPPPRPYERTDEESAAISAAEVKAHFGPKPVEPKEVYSDKQKDWALGFCTHPSQIEINRPDDYVRTIRKGLPSTATLQKRKEVAQLGA